MNHKWKPLVEMEFGTKPQECVHCLVTKSWRGGDYQCWQYVWVESAEAHGGGYCHSIKKSFHRPDCTPKTVSTK